jgi:hypothetical protein
MDIWQLLEVILFALIYFFPTIKAAYHKNPKVRARVGDFFIMNMLIGWTVVGWIVLLLQQNDE